MNSRLSIHAPMARLPAESWLLPLLLALELTDVANDAWQAYQAQAPIMSAQECLGWCAAQGAVAVGYSAEGCSCAERAPEPERTAQP